jgi:hypothetical protein
MPEVTIRLVKHLMQRRLILRRLGNVSAYCSISDAHDEWDVDSSESLTVYCRQQRTHLSQELP